MWSSRSAVASAWSAIEPAGARAVEDQHLLTPDLSETVGHDARRYIRGAASGCGHDDFDRSGRPALSLHRSAAD